jgi:hypothetical protein
MKDGGTTVMRMWRVRAALTICRLFEMLLFVLFRVHFPANIVIVKYKGQLHLGMRWVSAVYVMTIRQRWELRDSLHETTKNTLEL